MSVVIDDTPYPRFPITPREGLVLTIGVQKRVIYHIEVSLDTLEVRCDTRPLLPVTKPEQDKPAEEPPAKTNAEEPESTDGTRATTKKVPREQRGKA